MSHDQDRFEDLLDSGEMNDFLFRAKRDMFPKMKVSIFSLVIGGPNADVKLCLEVGAAILFDKPLLVVLKKGDKIPDRLRNIAEEVIELDEFSSDSSGQLLRAAINRMAARAKAKAK